MNRSVDGWALVVRGLGILQVLLGAVLLALIFGRSAWAVTLAELNACDHREWVAENGWSDVTTTLTYDAVGGRAALKASFAYSHGSTYAFIRVNQVFAPEDWTGVTAVRADVYVQSTTSKNIELELKDLGDNQLAKPNATGIAPGSWVTVTWTLPALSGQVARLFLIPGGLLNNDAIYFSNLRLVRGAVEEPWESFAAPSYEWRGNEDFLPWHDTLRNEPVSHRQTHNASAGAAYCPWDATRSGSINAKLEAMNLHGASVAGNTRIRAWVRTTRADAPIYVAFWDGANWIPTASQAVAAAQVWQLLEWTIPSSVNLAALQTFMFMVDTSAGGTGETWFDDLEFSATALTPTPTPTPSRTRTATPTPTPTQTLTRTPTPVPNVVLWSRCGSASELTAPAIGVPGQINGALDYLPAKFNNGFKPQARTGDRNIPSNFVSYSGLQLGAQGCIEFWFLPDWNSGGHERTLFEYGIPGSSESVMMSVTCWGYPYVLCFNVYSADHSKYISKYFFPGSTPGWSTTQPFHLAFVWDSTQASPGARAKIFFNGAEINQTNVGQDAHFEDWNPACQLFLASRMTPGGWDLSPWEGSEGIIDNVKVYNYPKTDFSDRFNEYPYYVSPTVTLTATPSSTATRTATVTRTSTRTPVVTPTPSPTITGTSTRTPVFTATPTTTPMNGVLVFSDQGNCRHWTGDGLVTYGGRQAWVANYDPNQANGAGIKTAYFYPENWSDVSAVKIDLWIQASSPISTTLALGASDGQVIQSPVVAGVSPGAWTTVSWPVSPGATPVSWLSLGTINTLGIQKIYHSNLRLVRNGVEESWEPFNAPNSDWQPFECYNKWNTAPLEPITHTLTHDGSPGAIYLPWTGPTYSTNAKVEAQSPNWQGSTFNLIRAWVYSDNDQVGISVGMWTSQAGWVGTNSLRVNAPNTWQLLEWVKPVGANWPAGKLSFVVSVGYPSGNVYVDDVEIWNLTQLPPTKTFTVTPTSTGTRTASPTPTATRTRTASPTASPTATPTCTATPMASLTPDFDQLNACDTRRWKPENAWSDVRTTLGYTLANGRPALQADFERYAGVDYAFLSGDPVAPEDWSGVTAIRMDLYYRVANYSATKTLSIQIQDANGNTIQNPMLSNLSGGWTTRDWPITPFTTPVGSLMLVPGGIRNGDSLCISNLRLVRNGVEEPWEPFNGPSYLWQGGEDFVPWRSGLRIEPVSHRQTHGAGAGAVRIPWDAAQSGSTNAKMEAMAVYGMNLSGTGHVSAWVYSDRTDAPVYMAYWDGANWIWTDQVAVTAANTWQLLSWNVPAGVNWPNLQTFMFMVNTSAGGSGTTVIDDLQFLSGQVSGLGRIGSAGSVRMLCPVKSATPTATPSATATPPATATPTATPTPPAASYTAGAPQLAYPNPARGRVCFAWADGSADLARVEIFNLRGEPVATVRGAAPGGGRTFWETAGIAPGIYLYRIVLVREGRESALPFKKVAIVR